MSRQTIIGAVYFPVFLLVWTAGLAMVFMYVQPAGANSPAAPQYSTSLPEVSTRLLDDDDAWRDAMGHLGRYSRVANGSWQPIQRAADAASYAVPVPRTQPQVIVLAAVAEDTVVRGDTAADAQVSSPEHTAVGRHTAVVKTVVVPAEAAPLSRELVAAKSAARRDLKQGRFFAAYQGLRPRVSEARNDVEFLGLLALAALRAGSHGEAMVLYQRLAGLQPDNGRWRAGLALSQEHLGLDATPEFREALARAEDSGAQGIGELLRTRLDSGDVG